MKIKLHYVIVDAEDGYATLKVFGSEKDRTDFEAQCAIEDQYIMDNGHKIIDTDLCEVVE